MCFCFFIVTEKDFFRKKENLNWCMNNVKENKN